MSSLIISNISSFENETFGRLRVLTRGEELWFVGADVAKGLGYVDVTQAVDKHCKKAELMHPVDLTGCSGCGFPVPPSGIKIIPESDLYRLIMRSQLPSAEKFQDWVTEEVLPSIRKTGEYVVEKPSVPTPSVVDIFTIEAQVLASCLEGNQYTLAIDKCAVKLTGHSALKDAEIELIAPQQCQLYTPSELGRQLEPPLSPIKVNKLLATMGWQVKVEKKWEAIGDGVKYAVYLDTGKAHSDGTPVRQLKWTADVIFALQGQLNSDE